VVGFLNGFRYAWQGVVTGCRGRNFRVMLAAALGVILLGYIYHVSLLEWALLTFAMGSVLALELVNTAGEKLVDILCPDHDPRYGLVKDILAGAVLVAAVAAAVVGALIFLPRLGQ
jgi:undecaprenol kinase